MAITSAADLESRFQENDSPTSADFAAVFDSFLHKVSAAGTALAVRSLGAGLAGSAMFAAATTAAGRSLLGLIAGEAATTASAKTLMGLIVGDAVATASAQTLMGGGAVGTHLFEAATTASARRDLDLNVATTAQMSGPTNTSSAFVTPGLQHYHPLMPKAWANFTGAGTVSVREGWNVASIGDLAAGQWRINWGSAFSNAAYAVIGMLEEAIATPNAPTLGIPASANSQIAADCQVVANVSGGTPSQYIDTSTVMVMALSR